MKGVAGSRYTAFHTARSSRDTSFYVAGGNLMPGAPSYVVRPADDELFQAIQDGHYAYVLTSRQMGKSSLMHRTAIRLQEAGITPVLLDLTSVGANLTVEQWYFGLLAEIGVQLALSEEMERYWSANERHGPLYRFIHALDDVVLANTDAPLAIFIDEIDFVRGLKNFSTDEFFAAIRQCYNGRAGNERMCRLTFCLLGVATPADLIRDLATTPFNIGRQIELTDFTPDEAQVLAPRLDADPRMALRKLERIFSWTNGHPYLTQKLCLALSHNPDCPLGEVDRICHEMFLVSGARRSEDNLIFAHNTLRSGSEDPAAVIGLYRKVLSGKMVPHDPADPVVAQLRLAGVVRVANSRLRVRNKIYAQAFDRRWVDENMPDAAVRREKAAFRRGAWRTAVVFGLLAIILGVLTWMAVHQAHRASLASKAAKASENQTRALLYVADMNLAQADLQKHDPHNTEALLQEHRNDPERSFDWSYLWSQCHKDRVFTYPNGSMVYNVKFSPDGKILAIGSVNNTVLVYMKDRIYSHYILCTQKSENVALAFTDYGKSLVTLTANGTVSIWDVAKRSKITTWKIKGYFIRGLAVDNVHNLIAVAGDFGVTLFNARGELYDSYRLQPNTVCSSISFAPNGHFLVAGCSDNTTKIFGVLLHGKIKTLQHFSPVNSVDVSQDSCRIVTGSDDGIVRVWNALSGKELCLLQSNTPVTDGVFSSTGHLIASGGMNNSVTIWDGYSGNQLNILDGHTKSIKSVAFSPNELYVASGSADGTVIIWKIAPNADHIALDNLPSSPSRFALSPNSQYIAAYDITGLIRIWNTSSGHIVNQIYVSPGSIKSIILLKDKCSIVVNRVIGNPVVYNNITKVFVSPDRMPVNSLVSILAVSKDNNFALVSDNQKIVLTNLVGGNQRHILFQDKNSQTAAAFSQDNTLLTTIDNDNIIRVWQVFNGKLLAAFPGGKKSARAVVFTPDKKEIVTAGDDGTINAWNLRTLRQTTTIETGTRIDALAFTKDGSMLEAACPSLGIRWFRASLTHFSARKQELDSQLPLI